MDYAAQLRGAIRDFAVTGNGTFLVISEDPIFVKMLQSALFKQLNIPQARVTFFKSIEKLLATLHILDEQGMQPFIMLEQRFRNRPLDQYVPKIKKIAKSSKIIVLTNEITRDSLALLYELGIDNTIVKPLSLNTLIEKIANAIKPPAKLGKLIEQTRTLLAENDAPEALKLTDSILALKPDCAAGLMLRGDALKALKQTNEAIIQYQQAVDAAPLYVGPLKRLLDLHVQQGNTKQELYYLEKLDSLSPLNYERKISMGKANLALDKPELAQQCLDAAVRIAGQGDTLLLGEVAALLATNCMEQYPEACEKHLRTIVELGGNVPKHILADVWNRLGISLRRQHKLVEAIQEYDKAIRRMPEDENLYFNRALAQTEAELYAAAAESLDMATRINSEFGQQDADIYTKMGRIYQLAEQRDKAKAYFELALLLKPDSAIIQKWMKKLN